MCLIVMYTGMFYLIPFLHKLYIYIMEQFCLYLCIFFLLLIYFSVIYDTYITNYFKQQQEKQNAWTVEKCELSSILL